MKKCLSVLLISLVLFSACKENTEEPAQPAPVNYSGMRYTANGTLNISLAHKFNNAELVRNSGFVTAAGDTIKLDQLIYYFSNVQLKNEKGSWVNLKNYNLVNIENLPSLNIKLSNVPAGIYSKVRFTIGVDSIANSSGTQDGDLSPANNMFWGWSTGYIFIRIRGSYNQASPFSLDVGGNRNLAVVELDLTRFKKEGTNLKLNTSFNLAGVFNTPAVYDLKTMPATIHSATSEGAAVLAGNIQAGVFTVTSVD